MHKYIGSFCIPTLVLAYSTSAVAGDTYNIQGGHIVIQGHQGTAGNDNTNNWNNRSGFDRRNQDDSGSMVRPPPWLRRDYGESGRSSQSSSSYLPEQRSPLIPKPEQDLKESPSTSIDLETEKLRQMVEKRTTAPEPYSRLPPAEKAQIIELERINERIQQLNKAVSDFSNDSEQR